MNKISLFFALVMALFSQVLLADNVRFRTPAINGKLHSNNVELTDWQTVMSCHFDYQGSRKQSIRSPQTIVKKIDSSSYSIKIKAGSLTEFLPRHDLLTCAYKLILIGKNTNTHQLSFGDIYLMGKETGVMSESELQAMQDFNNVTKVLNERTKELLIANGKDGGIVEDN